MIYVLGALLTGLAAAVAVLHFRRAGQAEESVKIPERAATKENLILVLLRKTPANLEAAHVETAARRAWEKKFGPNKNNTAFVERGVPAVMFVLHAHGNAFMVLGGAKASRKVKPPSKFYPSSAANLWERASHDLSISVVHHYDPDPAKLGLYVGRLAAALCDKDSVAVFHPPSGRLWKLDQSIVEQLARKPETFFRP